MSACMCIIVCVCVCRDPLPSYTHYRPFSLSHFRLMALYSRAGLAAGGDLAFDCLDAEHMWERTCSCPAESTSLSQSYKHTLPSSLTLSSRSFTFTAPPSHSLTYFNTYCFSLSVHLLDCMSFCMFSHFFFSIDHLRECWYTLLLGRSTMGEFRQNGMGLIFIFVMVPMASCAHQFSNNVMVRCESHFMSGSRLIWNTKMSVSYINIITFMLLFSSIRRMYQMDDVLTVSHFQNTSM